MIIKIYYLYIKKLALFPNLDINKSDDIEKINEIIEEIKRIKVLIDAEKTLIVSEGTLENKKIVRDYVAEIDDIVSAKQQIIAEKEKKATERQSALAAEEAARQSALAAQAAEEEAARKSLEAAQAAEQELERQRLEAERQRFELENKAKIDIFNAKLTEELKVKNKLDLTYTDIKVYRDDYESLKNALLLNFDVKQGNTVVPPALDTILSITPVSLPNINQNFNAVFDNEINVIIDEIKKYVSTNAFFPNIEDRTKLDDLVNEIYTKIGSKVYPKLNKMEIQIISKKKNEPENSLNNEFNKEIYDQGINYAELNSSLGTAQASLADKIRERDEKWIEFLSNLSNLIEVKAASESGFDEIKHQGKTYYIKKKTLFDGKGSVAKNITENTNYEGKKTNINSAIDDYMRQPDVAAIEEKIKEYEQKIAENTKKIKIYTNYFTKKQPNDGSPVAPWTDDDFIAVDKITKKLSNIYYVENFKTTPEISYQEDNQSRETEVKEIIKNILSSIKIPRETIREDPLATLRNSTKELDGSITIEDLKLSKLVTSLKDTTETEFSISSSRTLLLAISTRPDKVGLVIGTLFFAMLLSIITNPLCEEDEKVVTGKDLLLGGFKKYKIIKNNISQLMTGGSKNTNKIIYLDEINKKEEINKKKDIDKKKDIQKKYKIIKLNK